MIELRRAVPEDLDCLFEAANSAFAGEHRIGKGPRWKRSREFLGDCLQSRSAGAFCWTAGQWADCSCSRSLTASGLEGAFVEAGHQGEGIGSRPWGNCSGGTRRPHGGSRPRRRTSGTAISTKSWALRAPAPKPVTADRSSPSMKKIPLSPRKTLDRAGFLLYNNKAVMFLKTAGVL